MSERIYVDGDDNASIRFGGSGFSMPVTVENGVATPVVPTAEPGVSVTASTRDLAVAESGTLFVLNRDAGSTLTLPAIGADEIGTWFDVQIGTALSSGAYKIIAGGNEFLGGRVLHYDTDTSNALNVYAGNGSSHVAVSMNGASTGGMTGSYLRFVAATATLWVVSGTLFGTGSPATPFATS